MKKKTDRWLLPEGIEEVLPPHAERLDALSRKLLDLYRSWGYELVMPPIIEYLESLLTGAGHDLDLQTFKLTDQLTGRMMGVRADLTPQVARIDAHLLKRQAPTRLCYLGTVLHTRPDGLAGTRSPLQIGVELYGHSDIASDVEVLTLMVETLKQTGIEQPYIDLGHVGIYRGLAKQAGLNPVQESELFDILQRKSKPEIDALVHDWALDKHVAHLLVELADLNGGEDVLPQATKILAKANDTVQEALENLIQIANLSQQRLPSITLHYDLAELRGYNYHTGAVFAAFVPGYGQSIAQGGRYDGSGQVFGRARPATGFSTDLKTIITFATEIEASITGILAPCTEDPDLMQKISSLRKQSEKVVCMLPGQTGSICEMGCNRQLKKHQGQWKVVEL